jgi:hypothetical protein
MLRYLSLIQGHFVLDCFAVDACTDLVYRNVGNELSTLAGQHLGTATASRGMFSSKMRSYVARFESAPYKTNIYVNTVTHESHPVTGSRIHSSNKV